MSDLENVFNNTKRYLPYIIQEVQRTSGNFGNINF
jgi:hypothetical protein